ncbi:MAG: chromate transporter [Bacillota bacterium]
MAEKQVGKKAAPAALSAARLPAVFWSFFKIGAFTFGGGWAMIPLIRKELVSKKNWIDDTEFVDLLAVAQSAPGPIAINVAVITGYKVRRIPGALVAALGASLPSFLVILAFATVLLRWKGSPAVEAVFKGMRPAIFGLLISAVWQVGKSSIRGRVDIVVAVVGGVLLLGLGLNPIVVVAMAAAAGVALGQFAKTASEKQEGD